MAQSRSNTRSGAKPVSGAKKAELKSNREKVAAHRAKMRAQGFRLIQMWVPDVRTPEFAAEARRQSLAIAQSPYAQEDQDFVESLIDWDHL